jgi:hypothetical protein
MTAIISTKAQERKALDQIREIVDGLGPDSYIATAFTGCFQDADENIEFDAAFSMKERWQYTEQDLKEAKAKIAEMEAQNKKLAAALDAEQEWKPYENKQNVSQADYEKLASSAPNCAYYMTDEEAKDWICNEFDFDRDKITILHEIDEEEVNRHHQCRNTGRKIDRRPIYCATDYHYIRFNTSRWYYEVWNDNLRPFYC